MIRNCMPTSLLSTAKPLRWAPAKPHLGTNIIQEFKTRAWEFEEPAKFLLVDAAWVAGDLIGHQFFDVTEGDKTYPGYYGRKLIWGIPFLLAGRLLSDYVIKGSPLVRAATIGTTANLLMQIRYFLSLGPKFNATVFMIHEALLVPLSFLIVGDPKDPSTAVS